MTVEAVVIPSADRPLTGQHVALLGKLRLLSRRDVRSIVERMGGAFSSDLTPKTTVVLTGTDAPPPPDHVRRVVTEEEFCLEAGLPDFETLRSQVLRRARFAQPLSRAS